MSTSIRLYLDENVSHQVAERLKARGLDAETARDAGMLSASDEAQLTYASASNRILLTHDIGDYASLARRWAAEEKHHAGIFYFPDRPATEIAQMVADACSLYESFDDITLGLPVAAP